MRYPLFFQGSVSALFGWGVYGLNILRHWQRVSGSPAYCLGQIHYDSLANLDPLERRALLTAMIRSEQVTGWRMADGKPSTYWDGVMLHALGNRFSGSTLPKDGGVCGRATCATIFFEDTNLPNTPEVCGQYALIVAGSSWCAEVLRALGATNVVPVIQGIEPALFHPAPKAGSLEGRFVVFSGGKLEFRKGQDLVLLAFKAFAERHPEALLVTSWHSPWPAAAATVNANPKIAPVVFGADGKVDVAAWAAANGVDSEHFIDLGPIPNNLMPAVMREADVALFPNRCEGGTNLVAMEAAACGLPIVVSDNTGHKDLTRTGATYALARQGDVTNPGVGVVGWGESDIDEIVETLEHIWAHRDEARGRGLRAAEAMARWSWRNQIQALHDTLAPTCP